MFHFKRLACELSNIVVFFFLKTFSLKLSFPKNPVTLVRALLQGSSPHSQAGGASLKKRELSCIICSSVSVARSEQVCPLLN